MSLNKEINCLYIVDNAMIAYANFCMDYNVPKINDNDLIQLHSCFLYNVSTVHTCKHFS